MMPRKKDPLEWDFRNYLQNKYSVIPKNDLQKNLDGLLELVEFSRDQKPQCEGGLGPSREEDLQAVRLQRDCHRLEEFCRRTLQIRGVLWIFEAAGGIISAAEVYPGRYGGPREVPF